MNLQFKNLTFVKTVAWKSKFSNTTFSITTFSNLDPLIA